MSISSEIKITSALDYVSGQAARNGAILDMQGYDGVMVVVHFAVIAAGALTSIKMQQDTDVAGATMADLAGTLITVADTGDNDVAVLDLYRPIERYVRVVIGKDAAFASAESAVYYQYGSGQQPTISNVAGLVAVEFHASPIEGTA